MKMLHGMIIVFDLMLTAYQVAEVCCVPPDAGSAKAKATTTADVSGETTDLLAMMGLEIP
jgi:hypothetical protein